MVRSFRTQSLKFKWSAAVGLQRPMDLGLEHPASVESLMVHKVLLTGLFRPQLRDPLHAWHCAERMHTEVKKSLALSWKESPAHKSDKVR